MYSTSDHTKLVTKIRIALGREPDFTLWSNSIVVVSTITCRTCGSTARSQPIAKPGLLTGAADLIGILAPHGRLVALEVKTGNAKPRKDQKMFLELVRKRGGVAEVVRSVKEARAVLEGARHGKEKMMFEDCHE